MTKMVEVPLATLLELSKAIEPVANTVAHQQVFGALVDDARIEANDVDNDSMYELYSKSEELGYSGYDFLRFGHLRNLAQFSGVIDSWLVGATVS